MDEIQLRLQAPTSRLIIAKAIIVVGASALFGYILAHDAAADLARGKALTKQSYLANFEHYKAGLLAKDPSVFLYVAVCIVMFGALFGLYEFLARLLALGLENPAIRALWAGASVSDQKPPSA